MGDDVSLLSLRGLGVTYPARGGNPPFRALHNFDLELASDKPQIIAVAGESGSGKTTLGRVVLGMTAPTHGAMTYRSRSIADMDRAQTRVFRREVQAIFQDPYSVFNPFYRVDHLLHMPLHTFGIAKNKAAAAPLIEEALSRVGLRPEQVLGRYPHQLSGGQRQRIAVARSLMLNPRLIVADEPVSMIDASLRATILNRIAALRDDLGISIIYITHDLATARQVADQLFILYRGETVESGPAEQVISSPQHAYTKLLVGSIPRADPDRPWAEMPEVEDLP
jgi:peptide/nickel transport system ATP-binding protein